MATNGTKDSEPLLLVDGQLGFSAGVQSDMPRTKKIPSVLEDGIDPNQLAWAVNASVRGGGIGQRAVLQPLVQGAPWSGIYQGGMMYQPDYADPFILLLIGGTLYQVRVDTDNSVVDLSTLYGGLVMPPLEPEAIFRQAEMFAVIQAGDLTTLPLFYDFGIQGFRAETLRRSNGLLFPGVVNPLNEIPAAGPMDFCGQRLWYAFGRGYAGGDIVNNISSGTAAYDFRDSVLKLTENPIAYGGDAFIVPTVAGNIRGMAHASNLNTALGETQLFIFTRRAVYACEAPLTRDDWTAATLSQMPLQKVALNKGGSYGSRCIVAVNGDLFFAGPPDGDIRSIQTAVRNFEQWGSVPLSSNIARVLQFNDRALLRYTSGINFDNRLLMSTLPIQTPVGVASRGIVPLDFDVISTLQERRPPAWEGVHDFSGGPYVLEMFEGDFGGRERAFAAVWSPLRSQIEVWEIRPDLRFENGENRVSRVLEFPAYAFGNPMGLKELVGGELWIDKMLGTVDFQLYYRPDSFACWQPWWAWQKCAAKDCREDIDAPCPDDSYPRELFCEQDAIPIAFPKPVSPICIPGTTRPATLGYQFQAKLVIKGWCRVRALLLHALPREKKPYEGLACQPPTTRL